MVENLPVKKLVHNDMTIEGWSRAAVQTYWRINELRLGFDLGAQPWDFMGTPTWYISHSHLDHIAALPVYVARRRMMKMDPPTIYMPDTCLSATRQLLNAISQLDRGQLPCELIGVEAGQEIEHSRDLVVTVHATQHTVPSVGYVVWERRKKLKPEYQDLTGDQIREIRLSGQEVSIEKRISRLAYLGDSRIEGLDQNPIFYEAEVLIMEMTFLSPEHRSHLIRKMGHIHLDDIVARQDRFKNQAIIAGHVSSRYHPNQVQRLVDKSLPGRMDGRFHVWI